MVRDHERITGQIWRGTSTQDPDTEVTKVDKSSITKKRNSGKIQQGN